ncbi:uncharacterized protein B0P05DRAFT_562644 [Gilbertella persicaria]|uniref:uncharacterized protein n=1 Tax=Gilbertella persicaria TaxID=101096 RepID=UPI00221E8E1F|nr:uncharacterized protein B0P05DRAFT_562644 [Gilbertella persicaria]KAI8051410.1 hypothetical protein B0P05DRAFT_562644 [Gilbertella persicaria]
MPSSSSSSITSSLSSTASSSSIAPSASVSSSADTANNSSSDKTGLIAGIVVAIVALMFIGAFALMLIRRKQRRARRANRPARTMDELWVPSAEYEGYQPNSARDTDEGAHETWEPHPSEQGFQVGTIEQQPYTDYNHVASPAMAYMPGTQQPEHNAAGQYYPGSPLQGYQNAAPYSPQLQQQDKLYYEPAQQDVYPDQNFQQYQQPVIAEQQPGLYHEQQAMYHDSNQQQPMYHDPNQPYPQQQDQQMMYAQEYYHNGQFPDAQPLPTQPLPTQPLPAQPQSPIVDQQFNQQQPAAVMNATQPSLAGNQPVHEPPHEK